jgi:hypothetical protein
VRRGVVDLHLAIHVAADAGPDGAAELSYDLRDELMQLDVDDVRFEDEGAPPALAKSGGVLPAGRLAVTVAKSAKSLASAITAVAAWVARVGARSVRIEMDGDVLEVTGVSSADQHALIEAWIERHTAST